MDNYCQLLIASLRFICIILFLINFILIVQIPDENSHFYVIMLVFFEILFVGGWIIKLMNLINNNTCSDKQVCFVFE